jgi:hypothetical protein
MSSDADDIITKIEDRVPTCPDCGDDAEWIECDTCEGEGYDPRDNAGWTPCPSCDEDAGEWYCRWCTKRVS